MKRPTGCLRVTWTVRLPEMRLPRSSSPRPGHLVGQAVCDRIDERHKSILPQLVWGNGKPDGVRKRAAEEMMRTAQAAKNLGVKVVNGFTGSSIWHLLYSFPPASPQMIEDGFAQFATAWNPILEALKNLEPGGRLVINAIRKEEEDKEVLRRMDYPLHLWMEKEIKSVANVSRRDIREFMDLAARIPIKPEVQEFALEEANQALVELKERKVRGAKVLKIG